MAFRSGTGPLFLRTAERSDDFDLFGPRSRARQNLGPASEAYDADFDGVCSHLRLIRSSRSILLNPGIETEKHLPTAAALHKHARIEIRPGARALLAGNHHHRFTEIEPTRAGQLRRNRTRQRELLFSDLCEAIRFRVRAVAVRVRGRKFIGNQASVSIRVVISHSAHHALPRSDGFFLRLRFRRERNGFARIFAGAHGGWRRREEALIFPLAGLPGKARGAACFAMNPNGAKHEGARGLHEARPRCHT